MFVAVVLDELSGVPEVCYLVDGCKTVVLDDLSGVPEVCYSVDWCKTVVLDELSGVCYSVVCVRLLC